jgi:hypothetical protein
MLLAIATGNQYASGERLSRKYEEVFGRLRRN